MCQRIGCGASFHINVDGAGTKYCSIDCKRLGYGQAHKAETHVPACAVCSAISPNRVRKRSSDQWPYLCAGCYEPLNHVASRLKKHHVPFEQVRRLLVDPNCEVCGVDLLVKIRHPGGLIKARLVVDHDHRCCPDTHSCGSCVRGFLCAPCNSAAGLLRESADNALALAYYLEPVKAA